jgi:hypothetical protein
MIKWLFVASNRKNIARQPSQEENCNHLLNSMETSGIAYECTGYYQ